MNRCGPAKGACEKNDSMRHVQVSQDSIDGRIFAIQLGLENYLKGLNFECHVVQENHLLEDTKFIFFVEGVKDVEL